MKHTKEYKIYNKISSVIFDVLRSNLNFKLIHRISVYMDVIPDEYFIDINFYLIRRVNIDFIIQDQIK